MKSARSGWKSAVLVCGKCGKKAGGGFGEKGRASLAKVLREIEGFGKGRKATIGVIETKCLGLCPKAAVTVVDTARPGTWLVVPVGADVDALGARLRSDPVTGEN